MRAGAGGLGAFAMRMGRMVIPIVREHILRVAEQVGKNLLETAIPEISQILAGRKKPSDRMLKHVAKTAAEESLRTSGTLLTAEWAATPGARAVCGTAGAAEPQLTVTSRAQIGSSSSIIIILLIFALQKPFKNEIPQREVGGIFGLKINKVKTITTIKRSTGSSLASAETTSPTIFGSTIEIASPLTHRR